MRAIARGIVAAAGTIVLTGCATTNIGSFVERGLDVGQYRTFSWGPADVQATGDPRLDNNRFFEERIQQAVERQLNARGFVKTAEAVPDLLIQYHASIAQQLNANGVDQRYVVCEDCEPYVYDAGTIVVDLVDARSHRLVWRGWAESSLDGVVDDQASMEKRVDETVARILERLPRSLDRGGSVPTDELEPEMMCSPYI